MPHQTGWHPEAEKQKPAPGLARPPCKAGPAPAKRRARRQGDGQCQTQSSRCIGCIPTLSQNITRNQSRTRLVSRYFAYKSANYGLGYLPIRPPARSECAC